MGAVYKAYDTRLDRQVALKVLPPEYLADDSRIQPAAGFARRAPLQLTEPPQYCHRLRDRFWKRCGFHRDGVYVEGRSLADPCVAKELPWRRALDFAIEIAAALAKAHGAGVIHRDLKPANIMLTSEGHIKLVDFGLARRTRQSEPETVLAAEAEVAGTVGYMSPEQLRGLAVDHRTDLFSFGVVLYELVARMRPFVGDSAVEVCEAILPSPPRGFGDARLPGKLKAIILRLLEKDPANRYATSDEVYRELKALEAALGPMRLSRNAWICVGAVAVVVGVISGWLWLRSTRERWALETAMPEIARLVDDGQYVKAGALTRKALAALPRILRSTGSGGSKREKSLLRAAFWSQRFGPPVRRESGFLGATRTNAYSEGAGSPASLRLAARQARVRHCLFYRRASRDAAARCPRRIQLEVEASSRGECAAWHGCHPRRLGGPWVSPPTSERG